MSKQMPKPASRKARATSKKRTMTPSNKPLHPRPGRQVQVESW
jgi:hypothetical protein